MPDGRSTIALASYEAPSLYIDGEWLGSAGRESHPLINPATGTRLGNLPHATIGDLERALAAAERAFPVWRNTSPVERGRILKKAAELIRQRIEDIARAATIEMGKPIAEARMEGLAAAANLEWFGEEARRTYGRVIPHRQGDTRFMVVKEPVGPVAAFAAWNFPLDNAARKIGASLAAGCPIIYKPGEEVPNATLGIVRTLIDAGAPPGVIAVVFGKPAQISEHLIASPIIRKISFTGSIPVGKRLMKLAVEGMKRTTMELGGHGPVLVFDDADIDRVVEASVQRKFRNSGQVCVAPTRFLVQEGVFDEFAAGFARLAQALPVGNGLDESNRMGPLVHSRRIDAMQSLVGDAIAKGARLLTGGTRIGSAGFFFSPTVLADVPLEARIMHEEPFGPIAIVNRFDSYQHAIAEANRLPYGLAAFAFTKSPTAMLRVSDDLQAGMVAVNSFNVAIPEVPFGGVKESGHGSENGIEGIEAYLVTKTISLT